MEFIIGGKRGSPNTRERLVKLIAKIPQINTGLEAATKLQYY
jgi:hypothetical protein